MKSANCSFCGKRIVFTADLSPRDTEAINNQILDHEENCASNPDLLNVPEGSRLKRNKDGKISIRCTELNPKDHFENILTGIHNLIQINKELENVECEAQCTEVIDELTALKKMMAKKYIWN